MLLTRLKSSLSNPYLALWTEEKIFMFFNPNVQLLLGLKGMNLFQLFYRHPLPVFSIMQISVKIGNAAVSKTFLSL